MTFDPTYLAIMGGIAAALAAGWQHARTIFGYVSSFVLVRATVHDPLCVPVWTHLRGHWALLPSGLLTYIGEHFRLRSNSMFVPVPFRVPASSGMWRKGWRFVAVSRSYQKITLTTFRGVVDLDALVADSCRSWAAVRATESGEGSWFSVYRIKGREKTGGGYSDHTRPTSPQHGEVAAPSAPTEAPVIDIQIDRSIAWPHAEYAPTDQRDDPFQSLWFESSVLAHIEQAQQWRGMGDWFRDRDLPWRRGWLLHGPGGTGKSSLAKALAQRLGFPLYQFFLATLSDQEFLEEWDNMRFPCVALFEDFDTVFEGRKPLTEHKALTFDCVLNAISGVSSPPGVFLIVTTNKIESIDPAMGVAMTPGGISTRPGRIDAVIELGAISTANRERMAAKILRDWPEERVGAVAAGKDMTPAQFQELCVRTAFEAMARDGITAPRLRLVS